MSILIKGMKMPKSCGECPCICLNWSDIGCAITASRTDDVDSRLPDCPLVEISLHDSYEEKRMGDYIKREDAKQAVRETCRELNYLTPPVMQLTTAIDDVPSADVVEVRHSVR